MQCRIHDSQQRNRMCCLFARFLFDVQLIAWVWILLSLFFFSDIDFFLVSLSVGFYPVCRQMVQVITPLVNKGFLKIPSSINNYYRSNMSRRQLQRCFHLFAVFLVMPDMYWRNFKRLHRLCYWSLYFQWRICIGQCKWRLSKVGSYR